MDAAHCQFTKLRNKCMSVYREADVEISVTLRIAL